MKIEEFMSMPDEAKAKLLSGLKEGNPQQELVQSAEFKEEAQPINEATGNGDAQAKVEAPGTADVNNTPGDKAEGSEVVGLNADNAKQVPVEGPDMAAMEQQNQANSDFEKEFTKLSARIEALERALKVDVLPKEGGEAASKETSNVVDINETQGDGKDDKLKVEFNDEASTDAGAKEGEEAGSDKKAEGSDKADKAFGAEPSWGGGDKAFDVKEKKSKRF